MPHPSPIPDEPALCGASLLLIQRPVIRRRPISARGQRLLTVLLLAAEDQQMTPTALAAAAMLTGTDVLADTMRELLDRGYVVADPVGPGRVHVTVVLPIR